MSLDYDGYITQIANLTEISSNDTSFQTMSSQMIAYAENRLYREGDFLATYITNSNATTTANDRTLTYPTSLGTFLVIDQICLYSSAGTTSSNAQRIPLQVASRQFVDIMYPSNLNSIGVPAYFAPVTATSCILGPVPDSAYGVEITGTIRPTPLSSSNTTTFLTNTLPDLFIAASMVFASGYMRNFGSQADNPQMAISWEDQYNKLFASAITEEVRKKYQAQGWQNQNPSPVATPSRV